MRGFLLILCLAFAGYSIMVYCIGAGKHSQLISAEAEIGKEIWQEKNCQSCHQLYGLGGYMGPDLTNVVARKDEAYIHAMVKNGTQKMPNFHLTDKETRLVIAFLSWVNTTGSSMVPDTAVTSWGSYNLQ